MTPVDARRGLAALPAAAAAACAAAVDRVAVMVADEARRQLGNGSGPGTPPADPHGSLADAIATGRDGDKATVTVATPYATDLEYGTSRAPARPFLRPAIASKSDEAQEILADALRQAIAAETTR